MPVTPLHGLAVLFLYFKDKRRIDPLALTASATVVDLEPLYYYLIGEPISHRIWHGYALALTVYPILITIGTYIAERFFERKLESAYNTLSLEPSQVKYPLANIFFCSLVGGLSHIFFDMFTHEHMPYVVYPLANGNPFYLGQASIIVELTVIILAVFSCLLWLKKLASHRR